MKYGYRTILAIDPGASGGLAWMSDGEALPHCQPMPKSATDIPRLIREIVGQEPWMTYALVEKVPAVITGATVYTAAMSKLQWQFGFINGVLDTIGVPTCYAPPRDWQKEVGAGAKKDYGDRWKAHLKDLAARRFPMLGKAVTLKTADALLILSTTLD